MTTGLKRKHVLAASKSGSSSPFGGLVSIANLVSYWKLNETSGIRLDSFGTNHLTPVNSPTSAVGKIGNASNFVAASSQALSFTDPNTFGNENFTVVVWFKRASSAANAVILSSGPVTATTTCGYLFVLGADGRGFFNFNEGSVNAFTPTTPFNDTAWHFFIGWHDAAADTINLQVDNGTVNTTNTNGVFPGLPVNGPARIGAGLYVNVNTYFDGLIDEVGMWRRILTPAERTALYNSGNGLTF